MQNYMHLVNLGSESGEMLWKAIINLGVVALEYKRDYKRRLDDMEKGNKVRKKLGKGKLCTNDHRLFEHKMGR